MKAEWGVGSLVMTILAAGSAVVGLLILAALYFVPTIVAAIRGHQLASVAVVNILLGWTFVGWVVALVMAVRDKPAAVAASQSAMPPPARAGSGGTGGFCSKCGAALLAGAAFCPACGAQTAGAAPPE